MEKIAKIRGRINPHYDMSVPEINEILKVLRIHMTAFVMVFGMGTCRE